jgi:prolipoprotein diacylglyceryl transferase
MAAFSYIYWNASPILIRIGPLAIRWYGLLFALLFWIGFAIVQWQFRVEGKDEQSLNSLLTHLVIGTIVGARLGHCLFYEPGYYLRHPLEILMIWEGGLASHGGAIGVLIALYLYTRKHPDQPFLWLLDRIAVPTALGGCLIRLGNLFNSEILGTPTQVPWAFIFVREDQVPRHPAQLYESIAYALIFVVLLLSYRRYRAQTPRGLLLGSFLLLVFTARFFIEFVKQRQAAYEQNLRWSVGQWLSLPFIVAGALLLWRAWTRSRPKLDLERFPGDGGAQS